VEGREPQNIEYRFEKAEVHFVIRTSVFVNLRFSVNLNLS
jgi:hypothetical protein